MGKRPNASQAITRDKEDELWRGGKLGISNPVSLLHTIWFLNIQHFGQRGQQEHASVTIKNFQRKTDESGLVYIEYFDPPTKTRQHGLHPNLRKTQRCLKYLGMKNVLSRYLTFMFPSALQYYKRLVDFTFHQSLFFQMPSMNLGLKAFLLGRIRSPPS